MTTTDASYDIYTAHPVSVLIYHILYHGCVHNHFSLVRDVYTRRSSCRPLSVQKSYIHTWCIFLVKLYKKLKADLSEKSIYGDGDSKKFECM